MLLLIGDQPGGVQRDNAGVYIYLFFGSAEKMRTRVFTRRHQDVTARGLVAVLLLDGFDSVFVLCKSPS